MSPGRLRAAVVIALIVVCSALAGAAVERLVFDRTASRRPGGGAGGQWRGSPEQDGRRRNDMLDRMTKELELSAPQRAGIDSEMQRTDSSLRAIRTQMQPRLEQVFKDSRAEMGARLDSTQREKFAKSMPPGGRGRRPGSPP